MPTRTCTIRHADSGERREAAVLEEHDGKPTLVQVSLWGAPLAVTAFGVVRIRQRDSKWMVVKDEP
jgi:hypothetical protein